MPYYPRTIETANSAESSTGQLVDGNGDPYISGSAGTSLITYVPIIPNADGTLDLGSSTKRFKDLYVSGTLKAMLPFGRALWGRPVTPHANDIEFDEDDVLPSPWVVRGTLDATAIDPYAAFSTTVHRRAINTRRPSHLSIQAGADATTHHGIFREYTFPTNVFVWARMTTQTHQSTTISNNDETCGLVFAMMAGGVPSTSDAIHMDVNETDGNTQQANFFVAEGGATVVNLTLTTKPSAVHNVSYAALHKIGTTIHGWVAGEAGDWVWMGSRVFTGSLDCVVLRAVNASTASPGNKIVHYDFIRFVESATFLP